MLKQLLKIPNALVEVSSLWEQYDLVCLVALLVHSSVLDYDTAVILRQEKLFSFSVFTATFIWLILGKGEGQTGQTMVDIT